MNYCFKVHQLPSTQIELFHKKAWDISAPKIECYCIKFVASLLAKFAKCCLSCLPCVVFFLTNTLTSKDELICVVCITTRAHLMDFHCFSFPLDWDCTFLYAICYLNYFTCQKSPLQISHISVTLLSISLMCVSISLYAIAFVAAFWESDYHDRHYFWVD